MGRQLGHIKTLSGLLSSIRRAYLNVDSQPSTSRASTSRPLDLSSSSSLSSLKSLTNEERDQIDLQARVILSQCADRVTKLERLENGELYSISLFRFFSLVV